MDESKNKVVQMHDACMNNKITADEYAAYLFICLENEIKKLINKPNYSIWAAQEDLIECAKNAIAANLNNFNPGTEALSNYFMPRIEQNVKELIKRSLTQQYDAYRNNEISRDEYAMYLISHLEHYIEFCINRRHRLLGAEYDDLMQSGRMAIIEKIDDYNPYIATPTSYFTAYINQYTKETVIKNNTGSTQYYISKVVKLEKVAKANGYTGITDPELPPDILSILSGEPLKTVIETIKIKNCQATASLDATSENMDIEGTYQSPEAVIIKQETDSFLMKQFLKCSPLERFLLIHTVLSEEPYSYCQMVKILKTEEYRERYEEELPKRLDQVFLEQKVNGALRKIRHNPRTAEYVKAKCPWENIPEQISKEDMDKAISCHLFDLDSINNNDDDGYTSICLLS